MNLHRRALAVLAAILVSLPLVSGCQSSAPALDAAVTVDLYSGVPNPRPELSAAGLMDVQVIIDDIRDDFGEGPPPPEGLGFRGFVLNEGGVHYRVTPERIWRETHRDYGVTEQRALELFELLRADLSEQLEDAGIAELID